MMQDRGISRQNYDRLSRWYDLFSSSELRITKAGIRLLNIKPGDKIIEIGFGTGHALVELANRTEKTGSVCGVDLSHGMVVVAKRRVQKAGLSKRISIQVGDATRLPFSEGEFDIAFMSFALELFTAVDIPIVLQNCKRVLKPGGRLGIVSLSKSNVKAVRIYEWFHYHFPRIVDCHPIPTRLLLEQARFQVDQEVQEKLWGLPVDAIVARSN